MCTSRTMQSNFSLCRRFAACPLSVTASVSIPAGLRVVWINSAVAGSLSTTSIRVSIAHSFASRWRTAVLAPRSAAGLALHAAGFARSSPENSLLGGNRHAGLEQGFERIHQRAVPPAALNFLAQDTEGVLRCEGFAVRPLGGERVVHVPGLQNARSQR